MGVGDFELVLFLLSEAEGGVSCFEARAQGNKAGRHDSSTTKGVTDCTLHAQCKDSFQGRTTAPTLTLQSCMGGAPL